MPIYYATKGTSGWTSSIVEWKRASQDPFCGEPSRNRSVALSIGPDVTPHIVYASASAEFEIHDVCLGRSLAYDNSMRIHHARLGSNGWEFSDTGAVGQTLSFVLGQDARPHVLCYNRVLGHLTYAYIESFALAGISFEPDNKLRLRWHGASEGGVWVERASSVLGPWTPVAENLMGTECVVDAPSAAGFFRLRQSE
jgi:hypothetical protein